MYKNKINLIYYKNFRSFLFILFFILMAFVLYLNYTQLTNYNEHTLYKFTKKFMHNKENVSHLILSKFPDFIDNFKKQDRFLRPRHLLGKISEHKYNIVIGIPTVKREISYLEKTLKSLFYSMNEEEKNQSLVVVMISEVNKHFLTII
jgi:hypothetical protein